MEDKAVTLNRFDEFVRTNTWPGDNPARSALIRVSASMLACREWFEAHGVAYTAADLVAMTRGLVLRILRFDRLAVQAAPHRAVSDQRLEIVAVAGDGTGPGRRPVVE
jgi:hypothetical protein